MKVFLSWSEEYESFVPLLTSLLEYHGLSLQLLEDSDVDFQSLAEEKPAFPTPANVLLVIASTLDSDNDLVNTLLFSPNADVLLLAMKPVEADFSSEAIVIPFHQDMLRGFKMLLEYFGQDFLPGNTSSVMKKRNRERREREDRRRADLIQRMRMGFWFTFARLTGAGKFDMVPLRVSTLSKTMEALAEEIPHYSFRNDKGEKVDCRDALEHAVQKIWGQLRSEDTAKAIILVEMIAEELYNAYTVTLNDRRFEEDRRES